MFDNLSDQSGHQTTYRACPALPFSVSRSKCSEIIISKSSETLVAQIGKCKLSEIDNAYN